MIWRERVKQEARTIIADYVGDLVTDEVVDKIASEIAECLPSPDERNGYVIVPAEPTEEMITAGLIPTAAWQNIAGSALTVNREKMRMRYKAMLVSAVAKSS